MIVESRYHLPQGVKEELRAKEVKWGFGALSSAVYHRTYSRTSQNGHGPRQEEWADTVIRVVEGVMSIRQDWITNTIGKRWNKKRYDALAAELATAIYDMKLMPPGRGLWAMGTEYVYERGSHALNNCFNGEESILTREGPRTIGKLVGETVDVWTQKGWVSAPVLSFGIQPTQLVTFVPTTVDGRRTNSLHRAAVRVTPDHRWILSDGTETVSLKVGDRVPAEAASVEASGADYDAGFVHGIVFGDGTRDHFIAKDGSLRFHIRLCGRSRKHVGRFENVTYPPSSNGDPIAHLKSRTDLKSLPDEDRSLQYVRGFVDGWLEADSSITRAGSRRLDTENATASEWIVEHAASVGYLVTGITQENTPTNFGPRSAPLNRIVLTEQHRQWAVESITTLEESEVYCPVVPGERAFTLANGVYTGNCGAVEVERSLAVAARWLMDSLMCGVGVGFTTHTAHIKASLPHEPAEVYIVPDTKEGWAESVKRLIQSYERGSKKVTFDYSLIRKAGAPIVGFGGISSGPKPLKDLHKNLDRTMTAFARGDISQTRCIVDAMNFVGACVVSGNVRRSAELAVGSPGDDEFMNLKNYERYPERESYGWMSNNSVVLRDRDDFDYLESLGDLVKNNGEPGILNLLNVQKYGRMGERSPDAAVAINPCGEIPLESYELCNLCEVFPTRCAPEELGRVFELATFYASTVSLLKSHNSMTNDVVSRNRRIGVSVSGVADWLDSTSVSYVFNALNRGYDIVRAANTQLAKEAGVPASIRLTTVKPSGTVSLLAGVSSGVHFPIGGYVLRRMRVAESSPVSALLVEAGIPNEPDVVSAGTTVFEFPLRYGNGKTRSIKHVSVYEQAALVAMLQKCWSDNAVSNTLTFQPEESNQVGRVLAFFAPHVKSLSLLPDREGVYAQMPLERIDKDEFSKRTAALNPVHWEALSGSDGDASDGAYCQSDTCEIPQKASV